MNVSPSSPSSPAFLGVTLLVAFATAILTTVLFLVLDRHDRPSITITAASEATVIVQVSGEIAEPGVYPMGSRSRLVDVIDAAGGLTDSADTSSLNLAARIGDGESITIPSRASATPPPTSPSMEDADAVESESGPVNVNTATIEELDTLPGIGPAIGERIIDHRDAHGPFPSIEALVQVEGISERSVERLRPLITVDD